LSLIQYVAQRKAVTGIPADQVYDLTGGNPLAIYLTVSLMRLIPPEQVLRNMRQGSTESIYRYIYWKAWDNLPDAPKQLLFAIQRVGDTASWQWLHHSSGFSEPELQQALQALSDFSLIKTSTMGEARSFSIHRLTSTFLCTQVLGWK
jgi:IS30 family transposase